MGEESISKVSDSAGTERQGQFSHLTAAGFSQASIPLPAGGGGGGCQALALAGLLSLQAWARSEKPDFPAPYRALPCRTVQSPLQPRLSNAKVWAALVGAAFATYSQPLST